MDRIVNPYIVGVPVTDARMFFGREDVFDWIQDSLPRRHADHSLIIHGQRRVGKTSILMQAGNHLPVKYIPIFFDLQGRTHTSLDRFLWWLAREIVRILKQDHDITIPLPEKEAFAVDPEFFEHRFLPELRMAIGDYSLLLTFDEFDNLEESGVKEELARPLIDTLRRLIGESGLNFIFSIGSSGRKLENMQAAYTEFFKTAIYKKISCLSREQSQNLVTKPVEGYFEYEPEAVDRIYTIVSGHPFFTQLTCHELFSLCQRTSKLHIRETDIDAVLDDVVERGTVALKFTWDDASDIEKWTMAVLAHSKERLDGRQLADTLRKQRVSFNESDLSAGVKHLIEKDVLTEENQFVIHLLRLWLQKNRPINRVREELTEISPIANRYTQNGIEYQDEDRYGQAIKNFRESQTAVPSAKPVQPPSSAPVMPARPPVMPGSIASMTVRSSQDPVPPTAAGIAEAAPLRPSAIPGASPVDCSVLAPASVAPGGTILVQVFLHTPDAAETARALAVEFDPAAKRLGMNALEVDLPPGAVVMIELTLPGMQVDEPVQRLTWRGRTTSVQFGVSLPADLQLGSHLGRVTLHLEGLPVGTIRFKLEVVQKEAALTPQRLKAEPLRFQQAFISYSSKDRSEVLKRAQMLERFGIHFFQDVLNLEPGARWEQELYLHIDDCDVFLLFWSKAARESAWVDKEVRYALERQANNPTQIPQIIPVLIEGPPVPLPPEHLAHLHFNDRLIYFMTGPTSS